MVHIICYNGIRKQKRRMTIAETGIIIDIVLPPRAIRLLFGTGFVSVRHSQAFRREDAEYLQITAYSFAVTGTYAYKPRRKEEAMSNIPSPGQIYRHFKGNLYRIVTLAEDSETGDMLVVYQALYGKYKVYARPLSMFTERLDKRKYPEAGADFRFELQGELIGVPIPDQSCGQQEKVQEHKKEYAQEEPMTITRQEALIRQEDFDRKGAFTPQEDEPAPETAKEAENAQEELNIDPLVLEFLDARSYEERLKILSRLRPRITDSMINVMSVAVDVEVKDGSTEERFDELRSCLSTRQRYESRGSRLR